jgi:hypothetical protein
MRYEIEILRESGRKTTYVFNQIPDVCPICHIGMQPKAIFGYLSDVNKRRIPYREGEVIFQCPLNDCQSLFIGYYQFVGEKTFLLKQIAPLEPEDIFFAPYIQKTSPNFVEIYNQSQKAEKKGWVQVAGPGYRKSFEFLIKDYCISKMTSEDEKEKIKKEFLGTVIKDHIDDLRIKKMAERAAWIGNDETHYVRTWGDKDLSDLKSLINITLNWINIIEITDIYNVDMPDKRK